jgi:N-acetylneuraminate lyase
MELAGILPAVVTTYSADGCFAVGPFERLVQALYQAGVHGLYVCGQTGEGLQQPVEQRKQVLEAAVRCSPRGKLVIVHVGAATTRDALALARHAEQAGAHAISSLPPADRYDFSEIEAYYTELAGATGLPLLVYHHPEVYPHLTVERALVLCSIPNVAGFKFTDYNLYLLSLIRQQGRMVFNGRDEVLAAGLLMGANGGVGTFYNLFPKTFVRIFNLAREERWDEAAALQASLSQFIRSFFRLPLVPSVRAALEIAGLDTGKCVPPRRCLTSAEAGAVRNIVTTLPAEIRDQFISFGGPVTMSVS